MDLAVTGLIIIVILELILIAILNKKIIDINQHSINADVELFGLIAEIGKVLNSFNIRIKKFENEENEK